MGITERREREKEEVRRKILEAAQDLFDKEGYEQVTMRRIAEAIEYSPTTIYYHFEDKDDVVHSLCRERFASLLSAMQARRLPDDPIDAIRQLGRAYTAFGVSHPNHYRFMFMTPRPKHQLADTDPGHMAFSLLQRAVAAAIEAGRFRAGNPHTVAMVLWSGVHGAITLLMMKEGPNMPGGEPAPDFIEQVIEHGIRGFLATA